MAVSWLRFLAGFLGRSKAHSGGQSRQQGQIRRRPALESLEDRFLPALTLVSSAAPEFLSDSGGASSSSSAFAVSRDGRYVAFASDAGNLVSGDSNSFGDVFVRDTLLGTTTLASTRTTGVQGNAGSSAPALVVDSNGTVHVAFSSGANNLVSGDTNNANDIFVKNLTTGVTTRVSTDSSGGQANSSSSGPMLAIDSIGTIHVAFTSSASNLVAGDTNNVGDVFVKNLTTGAVTRVSVGSSSTQSTGSSSGGSLVVDANGKLYVAFSSNANNLVSGDTNNVGDVFLRDLTAGTTTRVNTDSTGGQAVAVSGSPSLAVDTSGKVYVAFLSLANNLVTGDTNGVVDVFLKDLSTGSTMRVSTDSTGAQAAAASSGPVLLVDANGVPQVAFSSNANNLVSGDTNTASDVFVKNVITGAITRISTDSTGGQANSSSNTAALAVDASGNLRISFASNASNLATNDTNGLGDVFLKDLGSGITSLLSRRDPADVQLPAGSSSTTHFALSRDGRYVAFTSSAATLVPGDTNGFRDVFVRDTLLGTTTRVSTDSSGNQSDGESFDAAVVVDSNGNVYVAFASRATNLVPGDTNGTVDLFVKNVTTGVTTRVSTSSAGAQSNGDSDYPFLAVDASNNVHVAFFSDGSTLVADDTNGFGDVFLHNLTTGVTTRVSTNSAGIQGDRVASHPSLLITGGTILVGFESDSTNLVAGDTNGIPDVFVKDMTTGVVTLVSVSASCDLGNGVSENAVLALDSNGHLLVAFDTLANNLVAGDSNGFNDVFVKNLTTGVVTLVSTSSTGTGANGGSGTPALVVDGANVLISFQSLATNLVSGDTNSVVDVFLKNVTTGDITRISVNNSGIQGNGGSGGGSLTVVGPGDIRVAFTSNAGNLASNDTNGGQDVFLYQVNNRPPVLDTIGNRSVVEGSTVTFTAAGSDPDDPNNILTYSLDPGAPAGVSIDPTTGVFTFTPSDGPDSFTVTVRVTDAGSPSASDSETITITVGNVAPTATAAADQTAQAGASTEIQLGSFTDAGQNDGPWQVSVDWGDGTTATNFMTRQLGDLGSRPHTFAASGTPRTVKVTITDKDGFSSSQASFQVTVQGTVAPTVTLTGKALGVVKTPYQLQIGPPLGGGTVSLYTMHWGDGTSTSYTAAQLTNLGRLARHTYTRPGAYTITIDATDENGLHRTVGTSGVTMIDVKVRILGKLALLMPLTLRAATLAPPGVLESLRYTWRLVGPSGQVVAQRGSTSAWPRPDLAFTPQGPGRYLIQLTVSNAEGVLVNRAVYFVVPIGLPWWR